MAGHTSPRLAGGSQHTVHGRAGGRVGGGHTKGGKGGSDTAGPLWGKAGTSPEAPTDSSQSREPTATWHGQPRNPVEPQPPCREKRCTRLSTNSGGRHAVQFYSIGFRERAMRHRQTSSRAPDKLSCRYRSVLPLTCCGNMLSCQRARRNSRGLEGSAQGRFA